MPPPCIYVFPATIPSPRNNPAPVAQSLQQVELLLAFHHCFHGEDNEVNFVDFVVRHDGSDTVRSTVIRRGDEIQRKSGETPIHRV
jgi:hypothetical protein